jgi:RNA polymerase III RPC4
MLSIIIAEMRAHGSSLTVEKAPVEGSTPSLSDPSASTKTTVKTEGESSKPATPQKTAVVKTKVKREEDDGIDSPDEQEADERIDLSELNFPGGPVSSSRRNDRIARGWKKVELWIEQGDAEEIDLDREPSPPPAPKRVTIKVEDDHSTGILVPAPEPMELDEDLGRTAEVAPKIRARRRRKSLKGKSREEKEEMAREELDLEVIKEHFSSEDGFEVRYLSIWLMSQRDQKLFLLQLPLTLPPLKNLAEAEIKEELKTEEPVAPAPLSPAVVPSGKLGQLRIHASGKAVLSYGGVEFVIRLASDVAFAQEFVAIHPYEANGGKAWRLGSVGQGQEGSWLIGVPELHGIAKHG